jgi:hypothetical protein
MYASLCMLCLVLAGCGGSATPSTAVSDPGTPVTTAACSVPATTITHSVTSNSNPAQLVFLDPATYPQAVCNDGTPGAYVIRPGAGTAASRWVLLLQGGDDCYDQATCAARAAGTPDMVSSTPYEGVAGATLSAGGIESTNAETNPDFYDATQVQALYCSSDYWSGAKTGSGSFNANAVGTWNFEGRAILAAVIADLTTNHGLGNAQELLLTGQSAGGVGVFAMVNDVAKLMPSGVRFVASEDAGFGSPALDYNGGTGAAPYTASSTPTQTVELNEGLALWDGHGDTACASATAADAQASCYEGSTLLAAGGTVTLPMLVLEAQKDTVQLGTAGIPQAALNSNDFTAQETSYLSYFTQQMQTALNGTNSGVSLFAPDVLQHEQTADDGLFDTGYSFTGGTVSPQQAVKAWYQNPCAPVRNVAN